MRPKEPGAPESSGLSAEASRAITVRRQSIFLGPLPTPADLERYALVIPDGADRIMRLAEARAAHDQELERTALAANIATREEELRLERRGQNLALVIGLPTPRGLRVDRSRRT